MDTWKWTGVQASHVRVLGLHLRCTKMNQNAPIYTLKVTIARQTKKFWICPQWLIWLCTWGALKQETVFWCSSCTTPWLLHDFLWLLSPFKCPLNQKIGNSNHSGQFWNTLLSLAMVSILVHFGAPHVQPQNPFKTCSDSYTPPGVHLIQEWIILVTQDKFEIHCSVMPFWCILVRFGARHGRPHDPSMTCSVSYPLSSGHLIQKWAILVTQDKFKTQSSVMLWKQFWCNLVHFGALWCTSCATPWPLYDLLWLICPFKCPFTPEMDRISHSGQIRNILPSHGTVTILVCFHQFWCT